MRPLLGSVAALAAVVLVVGCSGPSDSESSGADGGGAGAVADEDGAAGDAVDADRQVITNASGPWPWAIRPRAPSG